MAKDLVSDDSDDEDVVYKGDLGIPDADDCATGSFCSSCAIPPRVVGGLWSDGVGCDACCYPFGVDHIVSLFLFNHMRAASQYLHEAFRAL